MDCKTYETTIAQWWLNEEGKLIPLEGATLGLVGESGEFLDALADGNQNEIINEGGDTFWYVAAICKNLGSTMAALCLRADVHGDALEKFWDEGKGLMHHVCMVADLVKKYTWHGKDGPEQLLKLEQHLSMVILLVQLGLVASGSHACEAFDANVAKLRIRYPDGFRKGGGIR